MLRTRNNESGFGALGIISLSVVFVLIAAVGTIVYKQHMSVHTKSSANSNNVAAANSGQTTTNPASTPAVQPPQTATAYLDIKEWHVKASYSGNDTFTYNLSQDKKGATVASKLLANKDVGCTSSGAGIIERFAPSDTVSPYGGTTVQQDAQQHPGTYVHVGDYYYLFVHSQVACGSVSAADENQANETVKASLTHLEAESN